MLVESIATAAKLITLGIEEKKPVKIGLIPPRKSPRGKGVFVRRIEGAGGVDNIVARARWAGLSWICAQVYWKDHGENLNVGLLHELQAALKQHKIALWLWGWPVPDRLDEFANVVEESIAGLPYSGLVLDVEGDEWFGRNDDAAVVMEASKAIIKSRPLGVTSYGYPPNFPDIPWKQLSVADFGVPQVYHGHEVYGLGYQAAALGEWSALGFERLVPALAAFDLTAMQMLEVYAHTPKPNQAVVWWDFFTLELYPQLWGAVRAAGTKDWGAKAAVA